LHLAWLAEKSVEQTLIELKDAGLASLTGAVRKIFRKGSPLADSQGKRISREYLTCIVPAQARPAQHLHDALRPRRKPSPTAWIICGNLRALQDETHGFTALIPLAYQPEDTTFPRASPTGFDSLRTIAVSPHLLDNFRTSPRIGRLRPETRARSR